MGFETLLGNQQLRNNLTESLRRGHISHFYLISGPRGSGRHTLAKLLGAAILCKNRNRPCGSCGPCRKVLDNNHPDFITVDDPEKKTVTVDLIRQARTDIYVQPNESDYKIYLFPRAQDMGVPGQNALLKVLEEPPKYGVFILITDNPEKLLPTVRSRCTELKMTALPENTLLSALKREFPGANGEDLSAAARRSGGFLGQAREILNQGGELPEQTRNLVRALAEKDGLLLTQTLTPMEKWKRDALLEILQSWLSLIQEAFACRSAGAPAQTLARQLSDRRTAAELLAISRLLMQAIEYTQSNVSPGAICGWLQWELR